MVIVQEEPSGESQPSLVVTHRFEVLEELSRRGLCVRYLAKEKEHDRPVCLDRVQLDRVGCSGDLWFLTYEAVLNRLIRLRHPNVAPVWDFSLTERRDVIVVLEHDEGGFLDRILRSEVDVELSSGLAIPRRAGG